MKRVMKSWGGFGSMVVLLVVSLFLSVCGVAAAQTTGTNAVGLISDNVINARDTITPLAIGAVVLFIAIAAAAKFWKRIFSK